MASPNYQRTEQVIREEPRIEAYKLGLLQSAKALVDQGINLPVQQVAGMTDLQRAAMAQAGAGIGNYAPYLTEAGRTLGYAGQQYGQAGRTIQDYLGSTDRALGFAGQQLGRSGGMIDRSLGPAGRDIRGAQGQLYRSGYMGDRALGQARGALG